MGRFFSCYERPLWLTCVGWAGTGLPWRLSSRLPRSSLKEARQRVGPMGRLRGTVARAAGLNPSCAIALKHPDAQTTLETNSVRISGEGTQAVVFLEALRCCQYIANVEKNEMLESRASQTLILYQSSGNAVKVQILVCRSELG